MIELRVLGPVEVLLDGHPVPLPAKQRALLAALALEPGRIVSTDRLIDALWDERPPEQAVKTIQVYVSQLRRTLGRELVETAGAGYRLVAAETTLDVTEFERLASATETLPAALALWRGPALADIEPGAYWRAEAARLDELRLAALEELAESELAAGRHARLVPELELRAAEHPERERLHAQLMLALYRSGRQEEALDVYRRTREDLVERLGIEPGPELRELHAQILRQDPELAVLPSPAAPVTPALARRRRRSLLVAAALVVVAALVALVLALTGGSGGGDTAALRAYVLKVENFLAQSHDAHREIVATIVAARRCSIETTRAAAAIDRVQRSRQSLLQQLAALAVPSRREAVSSFDLLQRAAQASIAADWQYRDWLRARRRCLPGASPPARVLALDRRATRLKSDFVSTFGPLARRFHAPEWRDLDF